MVHNDYVITTISWVTTMGCIGLYYCKRLSEVGMLLRARPAKSQQMLCKFFRYLIMIHMTLRII